MTTTRQSSSEISSLVPINRPALGQLVQTLPYYLIAAGAVTMLLTMPLVTWMPGLLNVIHPHALNIASTIGSIGGVTDAVGLVLLALHNHTTPE